ncbi:MAG: Periplasmic trehalase [Chlamydiae bacterium]|nr:Periplasmic trehalase [Chlamydiota bacterium]
MNFLSNAHIKYFFSLLLAMHSSDTFHYITQTWKTLERSCHQSISAFDPKLQSDKKPILYISSLENSDRIRNSLNHFDVQVLPETFEQIDHHGLLYLPKPYITPGGRFNEMYGWDSYFILLGLLEEGDVSMAQNIVDNQLYQVEHYGHVLNSNRSYHLTRSHPPFLSQMVLMVYGKNIEQLREAYPILKKYYQFWTSHPRHIPQYHLARYYDNATGPAIEVLSSEINHLGENHFDRVEDLIAQGKLEVSNTHFDSELKEMYYLDDRAMRESGFDVSCCFGPYGIETTYQLPVCLNTLIYLMEKDLKEIAKTLNLRDEKKKWKQLAKHRKKMINHLLWSEERGLYFPYNFHKKSHYPYPFLTTFYPLWAGIASREQAAAVVNNLPLFERKGGLTTSTTQTGCQWDSPYGWAPLQWIAVSGLARYGYVAEARRISDKFCGLVEQEFAKHGHMYEKYDVIECDSDVHLDYGYESNEHGFGWTNAVYLLLKRRFCSE